MNRLDMLKAKRQNRNGKRTDIMLPKNDEIKKKCKKAGARWDDELKTYYFNSDNEDNMLHTYTMTNYVEVYFDDDMNYDDKKEVEDEIIESTNNQIARTEVNGVWGTYVHVNESTATIIAEMEEAGLLK